MTRYRLGDATFKRKHLWVPCAIGARFEGMTRAEQAAAFKATYWADLVTETEWPALLDRPEATRTARYRLRRKAVGWLMALGRMAYLNPRLFAEVRDKAATLYRDQIDEEHPLFGTERSFEVDGEGYWWRPGRLATEVELPDGRTAMVTFEVGRIVSVEAEPASRTGRDADDEEEAS